MQKPGISNFRYQMEVREQLHQGVLIPEGISVIQLWEGFTAVEESSLTHLHIFPNPTRDQLNITGITGTRVCYPYFTNLHQENPVAKGFSFRMAARI